MRQVIALPLNATANISYTVPAGVPRRRLKAINFNVTTDATVGNRSFRIAVADREQTRIFRCAAVSNQAASLERFYSFYIGGGSANASSAIIQSPIPDDIEISEGDQVLIGEENAVAAADVITAASLVIDVSIE